MTTSSSSSVLDRGAASHSALATRTRTAALLLGVAWLALSDAAAQAQSTGGFWPAADSGVKIENVVAPPSVATGSQVRVDLDYTIVDARCPGCVDQIQYGWLNLATGASSPVLGSCIYDGIPGPNGARGHATVTLPAPSEPGSYAFVFDRAQHYSCSLVTGWWNGSPRPEQRLATIQVTGATDPLAAIPALPLSTLAPGVRGATVATTPVGRFVQLRYSLPAQPFDTERDYVDGPAGWSNTYGTGRPFFNVADRDRFGVVWQARNARTVYVTWFGADPKLNETFILPTPSDAILAAATSDSAGTLFTFSIQAGDGRPNGTRVGTLLKTDARGAELGRARPDMSATGLNAISFENFNGTTWVGDMQVSGTQLGLMFSRIMHASSDGLNHQGGIAVVFDTQTLLVSRNHGQTSGHSFDNLLTTDAQGNFLGIDLGDNYPRGIHLHRFNATSRASRVIYTFKTEHGTSATSPAGVTYPRYDEISNATTSYYRWSNDNSTYTELGGVIDTAQGIVAVFAGERPSLDNTRVGSALNDPRNLAMITVRRDFTGASGSVVPDDQILFPGSAAEETAFYSFGGSRTAQRNTGVRWLTNYTTTLENASRIKVHSVGSDALILWELWTGTDYQNTYAMRVRPDGTITQQAVALGAMFRLNRRDELFTHQGNVYAVAGDGQNRELILNVLVRGQ